MSNAKPKDEAASHANDNSARHAMGESAMLSINSAWKGENRLNAHIAAFEFGTLVAGNIVGFSRAMGVLERNLEMRKIKEDDWSEIKLSFQAGRAANLDRVQFDRRYQSSSPAGDPLPTVNPQEWQNKPIPERHWVVEPLIPGRTVTLYSGDGGSGKTLTAIQLIVALSLRLQWLGYEVSPGKALLFTAEDETDELHRRFAAVVAHAGHDLSDLKGVQIIPMAGLNAVLVAPDKAGRIFITAIYQKLEALIAAHDPDLVVIDTAADVFGGNEIDRNQVRQFIQMLATLALTYDCAVILLSHPSLSGLTSGSGTSGSTAWSNSVRSRLYLEAVKGDPDCRVLRVMKSNYGKTGEEIRLRWKDGVFVVDNGLDPAAAKLLHAKTDSLFMDIFLKLTGQGHRLSPKKSSTYAPKRIADQPEAKGYTSQKMAEAMQRLLDAGTLKIETIGPPSRQSDVLVATSN